MAKQRIIKFRSRRGALHDVIEQILLGFTARLDYMTARHAQVSVSHMTVRIPIAAETTAAKTVGACVTILRKRLREDGIECQAGWVREIKNFKEHFHVAFILSSDKIQSAFSLARTLNDILHSELNLLNDDRLVNVNMPYYPDYQMDSNLSSNYTIKIRRSLAGFEAQRNNIIDWLSYLAKTDTKGVHDGKYIREFGFSLLRRRKER